METNAYPPRRSDRLEESNDLSLCDIITTQPC